MNIRLKPEPNCPDCGGKMVLRRPSVKQDWKPFWGCADFPDCRGTLNINEDTGIPIEDGWDGRKHVGWETWGFDYQNDQY